MTVENFQVLLVNLPMYFALLLQGLGALCILATIAAKVTPGTSDDMRIAMYSSKFLRFVAWLPTIGVNARTKKLEEVLKSLNL